MKTGAISVVIPVRNEGSRIHRAVRSIAAGRSWRFPLEIIVVDDASCDAGCDSLYESIEKCDDVQLVIVRLATWSGIPFARNRGAERARYPTLIATDGNTEFPPNWDLPIWRHLRPNRMLAATILDMDSNFRGYGCQLQIPSMGVTWIPVPLAYGGHVPIASCAGSVIDRALFHRLGGYDESLPLYGAAEPEFSLRLWLSGCEVINIPELGIRHRFRPLKEHHAYRTSIHSVLFKNYLRFACYYLPPDLLEDAYRYYASDSSDEVTNCVKELVREGVWERRAELSRLPLDFRWFAQRFSISRATFQWTPHP